MRRQPKARSTKQAARIDRFHTLSAQTVSTFRGEADVQLDTGMKAHRQVLLTPTTADVSKATWVLHLPRLQSYDQQHLCMAASCSPACWARRCWLPCFVALASVSHGAAAVCRAPR